MFFLTGDSTLNPLVAQYSAEAGGMSPSFVDWFLYMSVPMLVALLCTLFLGLFLFKPSKELVYDREQIVAKQAALGKLSVKEIRTIVWLVIAIALWLTVSGDYIGWVTLAIGVALAMPIIGEVLTPASWNAVDIKSLMFLTAAMAVGSVGGATGMNAWIADVVLPSSVPENIFLFALLVAALSMIIHMFMGSVMAVLGVCVPAFISFAAGSSVSHSPWRSSSSRPSTSTTSCRSITCRSLSAKARTPAATPPKRLCAWASPSPRSSLSSCWSRPPGSTSLA